MVFGVLTPPENGAGEFSARKNVNISQEKLGSEWCKLKNFMYMYMYMFSVQPPMKTSKIIGNRHTNCVLRKRACYALRPPLPSSWVHSPSGPRLWTFTWSKPASGPEFPAPLNPMHPFSLFAPPHIPRLATNLFWQKCAYSGEYFLSLSLDPSSCRVGPRKAPPSRSRRPT